MIHHCSYTHNLSSCKTIIGLIGRSSTAPVLRSVKVIKRFSYWLFSHWSSSVSPRSVQRWHVLPCALFNTILLFDPPSCISVVYELFWPENITRRWWVWIPFRSEFFSGFNFTTALVVHNSDNQYVFMCFSTVQVYDLSYIHLHKCNVMWFIKI